MIDDLKVIKKLYGEKMSHLCRELFPTILEEPGKLSTLLQEKFEPSKLLYEDLILNGMKEPFKNYIYSSTFPKKHLCVIIMVYKYLEKKRWKWK